MKTIVSTKNSAEKKPKAGIVELAKVLARDLAKHDFRRNGGL
jgi:hypothetical protein